MIEKEGTKFIGEYTSYTGDTEYYNSETQEWMVAKMEQEFTNGLGCTSTCVVQVEKSKTADVTTQRRRKLDHVNSDAGGESYFERFTVEVSIFEEDPEYDDLVWAIDHSMTLLSKRCRVASESGDREQGCFDFIYVDVNDARGGFFFNMVKDVTFYVYVAPPPPPYSGASQMSSLFAAVLAPTLALLFATRS